MDLISREALIEDFRELNWLQGDTAVIEDIINEQPTIEAVPVEKIKRIVDRLKKELYLADKAKERCNSLQFDVAKGYATGIYNAIEFVKEELSTLDICEYKCNLD
jgi:hypothetical protein